MSDDGHVEAMNAPESPGVRGRIILMACAGFMIFTLVSMAALHFYFGAQVKHGNAPEHAFDAPRLQSHPLGERLAQEAAQRSRLETGPLPIERAMALIAARGASAYEPLDSRPARGEEAAHD